MMPNPSPANPLLTAALEYARLGFHVFPVHTPRESGCSCGSGCGKNCGKHPRTEHGLNDATTNTGQIVAWWTAWPDANIGIRTGAISNLCVFDFDGPDGDAFVSGLAIPPTPIAQTGSGGWHYAFRHPGGYVASRQKVAPGVDIRADGGYIVAAPSCHYTGGNYRWNVGFDMADPADVSSVPELAALLTSVEGAPLDAPDPDDMDAPPEIVSRARSYLARIPGAVSGEGGHETTWGAALAVVRGFRLSVGQALTLLTFDYNKRCSPPWTVKELKHKVISARRNARVPWGYIVDRDKGAQETAGGAAPAGRPDAPAGPAEGQGGASAGLPDPETVPVLLSEAILEALPDIPWLIDPILPCGDIALMSSEGGDGKTSFLVNLFLHLACGRNFLDFRIPAAVPVLYLLGEGARHVFIGRTHAAAHRLGVDLAGLPFWIQPRQFHAEIGKHLAGYIELTGAKLVALDTVGLFHDGDENSATDFKAKVVKPLGEIMRKYGTAFFLVHHLTKPSESRKGRHRVRGTSALVDDVGLALRLEAPDGQAAQARILTYDKVRYAEIPPPTELVYEGSTASFSISTDDPICKRRIPEEEAKRERTRKARLSIVDVLRREPDGRSGTDLVKLTGLRKQDVFAALQELRKDFAVAFEGTGSRIKWKLTPAHPEEK